MGDRIQVWMVFDVVALSEEAASESVENHIEKLKSENKVYNVEAEVDEVREVEKPNQDIEKGYSQVAEVEMEVDGFEKLVNMVINYGPTSVDIQGPDRYEVGLAEMRESLNSVAQILQQFLNTGPGGMMVSRPNE